MSKPTFYAEVATRDVRSCNRESLLGKNGGDKGPRCGFGNVKQVGDRLVLRLVRSDRSRGCDHTLVFNGVDSTSKSCRTNQFDDSCHFHRRRDICHETRDVELTGQRLIAGLSDDLLYQTVRGNSKRDKLKQRVDAHLKGLNVIHFVTPNGG
jgi:hypothetical protein